MGEREAQEGVGVEEAEGLGVVDKEVRWEGEVVGEKEKPRAVAVRVGPGEAE